MKKPWQKLTDARRRWTATVTYRTNSGPLEVEHDLSELTDLHDLIERGPHWDTISLILITRPDPPGDDVGLTI